MSVNSSSSSNSSVPPPPPPSLNAYQHYYNCFITSTGKLNIVSFTVTGVLLLLPLCVLVLHLGFQKWRRRRSGAALSHSDVLTCHMVVMELMNVLGFVFICCGVFTSVQLPVTVGLSMAFMNLSGQMFFHTFTCVERYLAVVHPVTYRNLGKQKGVWIRNAAIVTTWLMSCSEIGFMYVEVLSDVVYNFILASAVATVCFCSLSVLCVLIRPAPGDGGGARLRVDRSKLRPFYTITAILGALLVRFTDDAAITALYRDPRLGPDGKCGLMLSMFWVSLPSSLVLPLLFLRQTFKRLCCKGPSP
ncbi:uncharacterized protein V6R79_023284 [Siganus canaliculatus]